MLSIINAALLRFVARVKREEGQALAEYGLIIALVAAALIVMIGVLVLALGGVFTDIGAVLDGAVI